MFFWWSHTQMEKQNKSQDRTLRNPTWQFCTSRHDLTRQERWDENYLHETKPIWPQSQIITTLWSSISKADQRSNKTRTVCWHLNVTRDFQKCSFCGMLFVETRLKSSTLTERYIQSLIALKLKCLEQLAIMRSNLWYFSNLELLLTWLHVKHRDAWTKVEVCDYLWV